MIKRELTDESKSVSSLYNNIEIVLPNRCHEGPLLFKNPAKSGSSGPLKSFPLESQNVFFSDFIRFMCDFCPDNPAHTAIFDSPRDFCSQCVASCFLCSFSSSQPYYSICTTIPNYKALLNKLRGWRMERQPLFKSVISSRPFPALRWAYSSRFAALLAVCQT